MAGTAPSVLLRQRLRALRVLVAEGREEGVAACAALLAEAEHLSRNAEPAAVAGVATAALDELIVALERTLGHDAEVLRSVEVAAREVVQALRARLHDQL